MWKLTLKSIFSRKVRFALTTVAIVVGVAFTVATFMLTDSLTDTFDQVAEDIEEGVDLTVRMHLEFGASTLRPPVPEELLDDVRGVDGVAQAEPRMFSDEVVPYRADGEPVKTFGPPRIGLNFSTDEGPLAQLQIVDGSPPEGSDQFVLDTSTYDREDFEIGKTYQVVGPAGARQFKLVGTFDYGSERTQGTGVIISAFDTPTAQDFFNKVGGYDEIGISLEEPGQVDAVAARLGDVIPDGAEVVGQEVKIQESQDDFQEFINFFRVALLAFAMIIVLVSAFIINNTFTIVLGQRIRELALLRAIGATGQQVTRSVLGEAVVVGVVSTILGLAAGVGLAALLQAVLEGNESFSLPEGTLSLQPRTVIIAVLIGVGITLLVSLVPAWRARKVPPIAALRDDFRIAGPGLRRRLIIGGVATAIGALSMGAGLFGSYSTTATLTYIAAGALLVFVGVNLLSPTVAKPVSNLLGRRPTAVVLLILGPIIMLSGVGLLFVALGQMADGNPVGGVFLVLSAALVVGAGWLAFQTGRGGLDPTTSQLARENAGRNPRRTASTASALMIGLALVAMASVIGASLTKSFLDKLDTAARFDYIVQPENQNAEIPTFTNEVYDQVVDLPGVAEVLRVRYAPDSMRVNGDTKDVSASPFAQIERHVALDVVEGTIPADGTGKVIVEDDAAKSTGVRLGEVVPVQFADGTTQDLEVAAIYEDGSIVGNWMVDLPTWEAHFPTLTGDLLLSILKDPDADLEQVQDEIDEAAANYPVKVENREEFKDSTRAQINSLLIVIQVFLAIALLIAGFGIANTLALSVFERTRELGLLRAVGMTRGQAKRMIRGEAVIVSIFGGLLGVALGIVFGVAGAIAIPDTIIYTTAIPVGTIVIYLVGATVIGLVASIAPARRVANLDVLDAIQHE
jgi:putative ABC transport system permease protein